MLTREARGWDYEDTWKAIKACHDAGWGDPQIYRETFRLLLIRDSAPSDLLLLARQPKKRDPRPGEGLPSDPDTLELLAEYRAKVAAQAETHDPDEPEGGRVA